MKEQRKAREERNLTRPKGGKEKDDAADAPPPEPPTRDRDEGEEDAGGLGGLLGYGSDDSDGNA